MEEDLSRASRFEAICFRLLEKYNFTLQRNITSNINNYHFEADAIITDQQSREAIVEVKMYRDISVNMRLIEKALDQLRKKTFIFNIPTTVLIMSAKIDKYFKESFEKRYEVCIIDVEDLIYLAERSLDIKDELIELLEIKSDNVNVIRGKEFAISNIFKFYHDDIKLEIGMDIVENVGNGERLYQEYKLIRKGKTYFSEQEQKGTEILKYLFEEDLEGWHRQHRTGDGLNRFDLICKIKSNGEFWSILKTCFQSLYLVFEFKNYTETIKQTQVYTTEKYLFAKALRNVAIIISREGASANAEKTTDGILKESGKLILNIDDKDIKNMLEMKDSGSDPTDYLYDLLDQKMLKLSK